MKGANDEPAAHANEKYISEIPQFTLGMLWVLAALLNLPTLVAWTQNIQQGMNHTEVSSL